MYETTTVLQAHDAEHRSAISAGPEGARRRRYVRARVATTAATDLVIVTSYCDPTTANALRHLVWRRLIAIVGPHVSEPPLRYEHIAPRTSQTAAPHDGTATP